MNPAWWIVLMLLNGDGDIYEVEQRKDQNFTTYNACMVTANVLAGEKSLPPVCRPTTGKACAPGTTNAVWVPTCIKRVSKAPPLIDP